MENKFYDVLAVVPFTAEGKVVLKQAMNLQRILPLRIFVLHVVPVVSLIRPFLSLKNIELLKNGAIQNVNEFLRDFYKGEIPPGVIPKIAFGNLIRTLVKQARSKNFHFIILKKSERKKGIPELLDQNDIDKIIEQSFCPVLSINNDSTPENLKNIIIPIDISEKADKKLLWASFFAKAAKSKIQIVSALKINIDEHKSLAAKNAQNIKNMLLKRGIDCKIEIVKVFDKVNYDVVLNYIKTNETDMVIIRKHQIASSSRRTIGDFAKEIIHGSNVPVFTVGQSQIDIAGILQ